MDEWGKDEMLVHLEASGIVPAAVRDHSAVATVDAQIEACGGLPGVPIKNLLLKAKGKLIVVTALKSTAVDLKALGRRLNGSLRLASADLLAEIFKVPQGGLSPLAFCRAAARERCSLLLDDRLRDAPALWVHPCTNDATVVLSGAQLTSVLDQLQVRVHFADLEAAGTPGDLEAALTAPAVKFQERMPSEKFVAPPKHSGAPRAMSTEGEGLPRCVCGLCSAGGAAAR
ncbi:unnamed protein product [Pedinophyceae sp. YPF-701]|nr:unnamed protein product [Pedinophyceae sp. YPF-701]